MTGPVVDEADLRSRVARLSHDQRAYWVLDELNTKPGVTYLKRVDRSAPQEPPKS